MFRPLLHISSQNVYFASSVTFAYSHASIMLIRISSFTDFVSILFFSNMTLFPATFIFLIASKTSLASLPKRLRLLDKQYLLFSTHCLLNVCNSGYQNYTLHMKQVNTEYIT